MALTFYKGNCEDKIKNIPDKTIDLIYFNPPFGTTKQWWDEKINWKELFKDMFRVLKSTGIIAIHCSIPFNYTLIRKAPKAPNYSWYWNKQNFTSYLNANREPVRQVEEILVWKNKRNGVYNQQKTPHKVYTYIENNPNKYYDESYTPQKKTSDGMKTRTNLIEMNRTVKGFSTRPDEIVELMIRSYTNENDKVLDLTCYKGMSGRICKKLNRKWIGIDKYFFPTEIF